LPFAGKVREAQGVDGLKSSRLSDP